MITLKVVHLSLLLMVKKNVDITPIEAKAGDIIFFCSGMEHRVAPVTKGIRYSLVNWFVGPPVV